MCYPDVQEWVYEVGLETSECPADYQSVTCICMLSVEIWHVLVPSKTPRHPTKAGRQVTRALTHAINPLKTTVMF